MRNKLIKETCVNRRQQTILLTVFLVVIILVITFVGCTMDSGMYAPDFSQKDLPPSLTHPFGTDWMGRDMFARTIKGLSISLYIGLLASLFSSIIALFLGIIAGTFEKHVAACFNWLVDLFMGIPHLILLILISILVGKGAKGVAIGVILTHWCMLSRIVQAEILSLKESQYVKASYRLGKSKIWVAIHHMLPQVVPQFIVGLVLLFPHAIMHEASITFLGFGIPAEQPAIGIILSESMKYLTRGMWWLSVLPGMSLLLIVVLFEIVGNNIRMLTDPFSAQG